MTAAGMRVLIDGVPIRGDNSLSIVVQHLLDGWHQLGGGDELHLVVGPGASISAPASVTVHQVARARRPIVGRLLAQMSLVPALCRRLRADVLFGVLPATTMAPLPCPRAVMVYDLRYRVRPEQFDRKSLILRRVSNGMGFLQADGAVCLSDRTKADLLRFHPRLAHRPVRTAHLGADHVDSWGPRRAGAPYAIAFGHFVNKNVGLVLDAWAQLRDRAGGVMPLKLLGLPDRSRPAVEAKVRELGLSEVVTVLPWLPSEAFQEVFSSAALVVFPSDFEGFGLPAVEAMRLGIPVVVSDEPALLEVTDGHAVVMGGRDASSLASAVEQAVGQDAAALAEAAAHAERFTWVRCASDVRHLLSTVVAGGRPAGQD